MTQIACLCFEILPLRWLRFLVDVSRLRLKIKANSKSNSKQVQLLEFSMSSEGKLEKYGSQGEVMRLFALVFFESSSHYDELLAYMTAFKSKQSTQKQSCKQFIIMWTGLKKYGSQGKVMRLFTLVFFESSSHYDELLTWLLLSALFGPTEYHHLPAS